MKTIYAKLDANNVPQWLGANLQITDGEVTKTIMNAANKFDSDKVLAKAHDYYPVEFAPREDGKEYVSMWKLNKTKGKIIETVTEVVADE